MFASFTPRRRSRAARHARTRTAPVEMLEERRLLANPVANAGGPYTVTEGQTALLTLVGSATDADGDRISNYAWFLNGDNIADVSTSNPRPTVSYGLLRSLGLGDGPRTQTISLRVTDSRGSQSTLATATLNVVNANPRINQFQATTTASIGQTASYSIIASDPAGAGPGGVVLDPLTIAWTATRDGDTVATGNAANFSFLPAGPGTYAVGVVVTDDDGGVARQDTTLTVLNNHVPVADAGGPYTVAEGGSLTLDGTRSSDPDGDELTTYAWDLDNNGSSDAFGAAVTLPWSTLFSYGLNDGPALRNVTLRVSDGHAVSAGSADVDITNSPPEDLSISGPTTLKVGQTGVYFGSATDPAGAFDPISYSWTLALDGGDVRQTGSGEAFSFNPQEPGDYVLTLYADDGDAVASIDLTVTALPNARPELSNLSVSPPQVSEGGLVTVRGTVTDPDPGDYATVEVQWGDGNVSVLEPGMPLNVVGIEFNPDTGNTYYLLANVSWEQGEAIGQALGGHLVTINDAAEDQWVWNTFYFYHGAGLFWIGMNDIVNEGDWVWSSGEPVTYTHWYEPTGEPNDAVGGEDFGAMWDNFGSAWNDFGPGQQPGYAVVEVPAGAEGQGLGPRDFIALYRYPDDPADDPSDQYTINVLAYDPAGASDYQTAGTVTVTNSAPTISVPSVIFIDEGIEFSITGRVEDPGLTDYLTGTFDVDDGYGEQELSILANYPEGSQWGFGLSTTYFDDRPGDAPDTFLIKFKVMDGDGGVTEATTTVRVRNVVPTVTDLAVTPTEVDEGQSVTLTGTVHDLSVLDSHTVTVNWGDGQTSVIDLAAGGVLGAAAEYPFQATHTYADDPSDGSGRYGIVVTVADDDGGTWSNVVPPPDTVRWTDGPGANGHFYTAIDTRGFGGVDAARQAAAALGGYLVTILSAEEQQFLNESFLTSGPTAGRPYWIGLSDADEEGVWRWSTGELAYHTWAHRPYYQRDPFGNIVYDDNGQPIQIDYDGPTPITAEEGFNYWLEATGEPNAFYYDEDYALMNGFGTAFFGVGHWYDEPGWSGTPWAIVEIDRGFEPLFVTVHNVAPTLEITGAPSDPIDEGTAVHFGSAASDPGGDELSYDWQVFKDGELFSWGGYFDPELDYTFWDEGTYDVALTVRDGDGGVTTATRSVTVNNVAPSPVTFESAATGVRGQYLQFVVHFTDPGDDVTTATIDYGDGTVETLPVSQNFAFGHVYAATGTFDVTFTVSDGDGGVGSGASTATVKVFDVQADADDPSKQVLVVGGSTGADDIGFESGAAPGSVLLTIGGVAQGSFAADRLLVFAQAGDDRIHVAGSVAQPATVFGGSGDDDINGGNGGIIAVGGDGNDSLKGGGGRDLLVGGRGADKIVGNAGDDILVAGYTAYDADRPFFANGAGYEAAAAVWRRADLSYAVRIAGLNGEAPLTHWVLKASGPGQTVFDDGATDSLDTLQGSGGQDWFIVNGAGDRVTSQAGETVTRL